MKIYISGSIYGGREKIETYKKLIDALENYGEVYDTDDCTFDYLWKQNNGNTLKYSLMIFALILLF